MDPVPRASSSGAPDDSDRPFRPRPAAATNGAGAGRRTTRGSVAGTGARTGSSSKNSGGTNTTRTPSNAAAPEEKYEETEAAAKEQEDDDDEEETEEEEEEEEEEESWRRHAWFGELGCAEESPEDCQRLLRASPLHNIPLDRNNAHSLTSLATAAALALWQQRPATISGGHGNGGSNGTTPTPAAAVVVDLDIYPAVLLIARTDSFHPAYPCSNHH